MTSIINNIILGESSGDGFGHSVSLSSDGSIIAISAPYNDGNLTSFDITNYSIVNENTEFYYQIGGTYERMNDITITTSKVPF